MKVYLLVILYFSLVYKGQSQAFDSTFVHSNYLKVGYDKGNKPIPIISTVGDGEELIEIEGRCKCEKNIKENKIAIQFEKMLPSQSFKERYLLDSKKLANRFLMNYSWYQDSLDFQLSQVTIYLTNNKVDSAVIKRVSEEPQFDGKYRVSANIDYFNIGITKTDYSIASDIWGVAKLKMSIPFGWTEDDCFVNIYFSCNNSQIEKTVELPTMSDGHR